MYSLSFSESIYLFISKDVQLTHVRIAQFNVAHFLFVCITHFSDSQLSKESRRGLNCLLNRERLASCESFVLVVVNTSCCRGELLQFEVNYVSFQLGTGS